MNQKQFKFAYSRYNTMQMRLEIKLEYVHIMKTHKTMNKTALFAFISMHVGRKTRNMSEICVCIEESIAVVQNQ